MQITRLESLSRKEQPAKAKQKTRDERPILHVVPLIPEAQGTSQSNIISSSESKFDARSFVFARLQEHPDLKLVELSQLAQAIGQELSLATASRYRKQFLEQHENDESSTVKTHPRRENFHENTESSTVRTESFHENDLADYESSSIDKRRVKGE